LAWFGRIGTLRGEGGRCWTGDREGAIVGGWGTVGGEGGRLGGLAFVSISCGWVELGVGCIFGLGGST